MSEMFVDEPRVNIPHPDTWSTLSYNQLLDVKNQLLEKVYLARGNKLYLNPLNTALQRLELMLQQRLADPRGIT